MKSETQKDQAARHVALVVMNEIFVAAFKQIAQKSSSAEWMLCQSILIFDRNCQLLMTERMIFYMMGSKAKGEKFLKELTQIKGRPDASKAWKLFYSVKGS